MRPRTIRGQLARILVVSLVLVLGLLAVMVAREVKAFRESGDTVHAVSLALVVQDLVQEAQRERGLSNGLLGGDNRLVQAVADQRANTDRAMGALEQAAVGNAPGAAQVRSALSQFDALDATRTQIDAHRTSRQAAFQFYTDGISALNRLTLGLDQARDAEIRHGLEALYALGEAKEQTAEERGFLNGVFAADEFRNGEYVEFLDIRAAKMAGLTAFARDATAAQQARLDAALRSENAVRAGESERVAIASSTGPLIRSVDPSTWWAQMTAVIDEQRRVQQAVGDDVQQRAQALRRDAFLTLGGFLLAALIAIAAEVALVFASVRAIVRPLAELAAQADDVANHRLPEVIAAWQESDDAQPDPPEPVRTPRGASFEIAAVAGALDGVQTTAFELASAQALVRRNTTESMANLARRNQNLVRRQLGLISEFEREELDPKALSNLFELDHLATRMRRNAESLLVLVGAESPRRWAEPIALTDVIRAGLSEVDDYRRVVLRRVDDIAITGSVVSDLAHMLAELIENGLAFSPPDLEVEIYGRKLPTGYLLAVVDHGVGMSAAQLDEANARLRGQSDFVVAPTRYLGHYVVGRLARRLGIDVELNVSPVSGIVARLLLPVGIIAGEKDRRSAAAGQRGAAAAGSTGAGPGAHGHSDSAAARLVDSPVVSLANENARRAPAAGNHGAAASVAAGRGYVESAVGFGGASIPGAPPHDVLMTGGPEPDGVVPLQSRSGPAHSRPGFASTTSARFAHFHSNPADSGDGVGFTGAGVERAVATGDRAAFEDDRTGDSATYEVIPTGDWAASGVNGSLTGLLNADGTGSDGGSGSVTGMPAGSESLAGPSRVNGIGSSGGSGSATGLPAGNGSLVGPSNGIGSNGGSGFLTGLPAGNGSLAGPSKMNGTGGDGGSGFLTGLSVGNGSLAGPSRVNGIGGDGGSGSVTGLSVGNGSLTGPSGLNGTGSNGVNGFLTGLPAVDGSGSDRPVDAVPAIDRSTDAASATEGTQPAVPSAAGRSLWQIPETATAATKSDSTPTGVQRTKNGLVKRNKRARTAADGSDSAPRALTPAPASAPAVERTPAEIRSMLSSFRAGHQRGAPSAPPPKTSENVGASEKIPGAADLAQTSVSPTTAEEIR
ncbi:nitrate- and nitrite sensing domain-containing protein [Nocardia sp. NPDC050630]|uniref:sensor histidine kinase n=1 Tax=Nocardia sp. NPDC050630 TaxID=3364321 RepID=UPI00379F2524